MRYIVFGFSTCMPNCSCCMPSRAWSVSKVDLVILPASELGSPGFEPGVRGKQATSVVGMTD